MQSPLSRIGILLVIMTVQACSIYSLPGSEPAPVVTRPGPNTSTAPATAPEPAARPAEPSVQAAYQPLLNQAEASAERGDYEQALALLERAQRIDPDSAEIYLAMAQTHHSRGDQAQSRATAERGLLYCSGSVQCDALRAYTR